MQFRFVLESHVVESAQWEAFCTEIEEIFFYIKQSVDTRQGLCLQGLLVVTKNQVKFLEDTMVKDCIAQCLHI